ncbi:MAG TPA: Crp/Fnr family transcriptional regulator, partial [Candidatus Saccharimonadales bacterium]|nr:Crp/Fnr family transcriptional regulator [Candidatus Saccharimonadales bacterium]
WAINRDPNHFFYKTETETELHIVPADAAVAFLRDNPDVMYDLLARIYKGTEGLLGRLVHLMSGTAQSRLMYELILEGRRFGQAEQDGSVVLAINEGDLAARTGLSRETVSREVSKLKDRNLVTIAPKNLRILDMSALEQALGGEV